MSTRILTIANPRKGSTIWIIKYGNRASFWHDSWNGYVPFDNILGMEEVIEAMSTIYEDKVSSYVSIRMEGGGLDFEWRSFKMLDAGQRRRLVEELKNQKILFMGEQDTIILCVAKSGNYSPKIGYEVLKRGNTQVGWPKKLC